MPSSSVSPLSEEAGGASSRRTLGSSRIVDEIRAGVASAAVTLGILLPLGLLPYAVLGEADAAALGIRAAFVASIVGGAIIALVGGSPVPGSGPRTSTTLVFAAFIAGLAADPALRTADGFRLLIALASACVALSGLVQMLFAATRLGSIATYVPVPVVAGFMDGIAILVIVAQLRLLLPPAAALSTSAIAVAAATAAIAFLFAWRWTRVPWALVGIAAGTVLYWLLSPVIDGPRGMLLGAPAPGIAIPLVDLVDTATARAHLPQLVTSAIVIAVIGSLESLMSAAGLDARFMSRHSPNRMLLGQGIANLVGGALGGMPVSTSAAVQIATHEAGGRRAWAALVCALVLAVAMVLAPPILALVPVAATAGVMLVVGFGLFDQWSRTVWRQVRAGVRDRDALWALATVGVVCAITVAFGFVLGIAVGVALSIASFVAAQNRSLVRSVGTGQTRASRRIYRAEEAHALHEHGARTRIVEIEGAVFFGTAHKLERELEAVAHGGRYLIVDLRRVTTIDATGTHSLERVAARVRASGTRFLLAGIADNDRKARSLRAHGALAGAHDAWFPDSDRALEHVERDILSGLGMADAREELPLATVTLFDGLDEPQRARLSSRLARRELAAGEILFRRGEPGDRLFVLVRGAVTMMSGSAEAPGDRLATFAPGVVFGETAMLDGGGRTATGVADEPSVVYALSRDALDSLRDEDPALALAVLRNIARQLSARLRFANQTIDALR
jgi:MFS superfamily sulfate permease-like transporter